MNFFKRPYVYACLFACALLAFSAFVLLDTFVIARDQGVAVVTPAPTAAATPTPSAESTPVPTVVTDTSYSDANIAITIKTIRQYDTDIYVADIVISSPSYLKTALAKNKFGTNITQKTSAMAAANNAILAVNGDYYGANKKGFVLKNGTLYRDTVRKSKFQDLVIYQDGSFALISEAEVTAQSLLDNGAAQVLAFGPALVQGGVVAVDENAEVANAMRSNPRTAIGVISPLHYIMLSSDGRTSKSDGLSLYELASVMQQEGCLIAYNLDGGGSSAMVFNGKLVNKPTTNGKTIAERMVSDIVYIGY